MNRLFRTVLQAALCLAPLAWPAAHALELPAEPVV
jgi:hypothetical protein